jgi:hypothetical protein
MGEPRCKDDDGDVTDGREKTVCHKVVEWIWQGNHALGGKRGGHGRGFTERRK